MTLLSLKAGKRGDYYPLSNGIKSFVELASNIKDMTKIIIPVIAINHLVLVSEPDIKL